MRKDYARLCELWSHNFDTMQLTCFEVFFLRGKPKFCNKWHCYRLTNDLNKSLNITMTYRATIDLMTFGQRISNDVTCRRVKAIYYNELDSNVI